MEIYSSISPWVKICQGVARCGELPVERTCAVYFTCGNMASKKKKRKLSRAEWKKIAGRKGKSSAKKRGKGAGFTLPAKWREQHDEKNGKMQLKFVSPGKTIYRTEKCVAKTLTARNLELFSWGFGFKWGDWRFRGYGVAARYRRLAPRRTWLFRKE